MICTALTLWFSEPYKEVAGFGLLGLGLLFLSYIFYTRNFRDRGRKINLIFKLSIIFGFLFSVMTFVNLIYKENNEAISCGIWAVACAIVFVVILRRKRSVP